MRYRINVNKLNPDGTVQGLVETGGPCDPTYAGLNWFSDCQAKGINEGDCAKRICKYTIDGQNKDSYTAHNVQDINYGDDGYGAPENLDGFGIHVDATSHTVPASMFASLAPGTTIQVVLDGADGPPDMKPVCDPVERRITIPVPPRNSCEVHVVPSTSLVGSTMTVSAGAGIADPSVGKMQVWLEKKDGTQIASYATAVGYTYNGGTVGTITETHPASGNYYYRLNELTCNGPAGTSCSAPTGNVQIQNPNDYYFHCDVVPNGGGSSRPPPPTL